MVYKMYVVSLMLLMVIAQASKACCGDSTVTVSGSGQVNGIPNIATFSITIQETANTSKDASAAANVKTTRVLSILAANNVSKNDIQTAQLTISPQYDWTNGTQTFKGQQATQTISVKLRNINPDGSSIGALIDALTTINNITLSGISFDIDNKAPLNKQARSLAYDDAKTKATQYAQLSGLRLGQALTITDNSANSSPPVFFALAKVSSVADTSTQVPVGQLQVSNDVTITFKLI
jgi:uncharacterized protein YggE